MSYDASNIINIVTRISPQGLSFANFSLAMLFAPEDDLPVGFDVNTFRVYSSLSDLEVDFDSATETYKAAQRYMAMIPTPQELRVWGRKSTTAAVDTIVDTLGIAANETWWYWTLFTDDVYNSEADVLLIADWLDANIRYAFNCSTAADIRDIADATDIATQLTTKGTRHISTFSHATDPYAGHALMAWFSSVNYSIPGSTITGEFKKLPGVTAEDLTATEYASMILDTKKAAFYTNVDLQGSNDVGRVINSWSHSSFGEYMDDIINLDAFVNDLRVSLYNSVANQTTKLPQTPPGQAVLLAAAKETGERYIANGYLGPRNWTNPDNGLDELTLGYEILTQPEDILDISDPERADRKSAPVRIRIFRAGAIHAVDVTVDVF
jgi:hypothetical protein